MNITLHRIPFCVLYKEYQVSRTHYRLECLSKLVHLCVGSAHQSSSALLCASNTAADWIKHRNSEWTNTGSMCSIIPQRNTTATKNQMCTLTSYRTSMVHLRVYLRDRGGNSKSDRQRREKWTTHSICQGTWELSVKHSVMLIIRREKKEETFGGQSDI